MDLLFDRTTVVAIGTSRYEHLPRLSGPRHDLDRVKKLFCTGRKTSIVSKDRFVTLEDSSSAEIRQWFSDYALSRTAPNDVLIVYFSGHGAVLPDGDFAFCTKETQFHFEYHTAVPTNLVRFSDLVQSLAAVHVDPVFIIDACFSGEAGAKIDDHTQRMQRTIQAETGSSYALLVSSTRFEVSVDSENGGVFSQLLADVAETGRSGDESRRRKPYLSLSDVFPELREKAASLGEHVPQLFLGDTLTPVAIFKNKNYAPLTTTLSNGQLLVLRTLWNDGKPRSLSTADLQKMGSTAHTTYMKLSYAPAWKLIEKADSRTRRLSERGVQFMQGKVQIPRTIQKDPVSGLWIALPSAEKVSIQGA